jgi:hypothetical protein
MPRSTNSTPRSMSDDHFNLQNILTNLAVRVGQLEGTLNAFMERWKAQDDAAGLGRRVTHEKIELLSLQLERLANDVQGMQQDVAELKKEVDEEVMPTVRVTQFASERRAGARSVLVMIYGGAVIVISALAYIADRVVGWLTRTH